MKIIKVRHFYRMPFLMKLLIAIGLPICFWFLIAGIVEHIAEFVLIGVIPLVSAIVGFGFFFSYGIKITSQRVVLINQSMIKSFRYEDVIYIKIVFKNESIEGEIKTKHQKACSFCFDGIDLSGRSLFLSHLWMSGLKLTKKFVDKSIANLSTCEKVKIQDLYDNPQK
ncbi:MAG: hypothetical protein IJW92_02810 [Clostridia bacterium]|nr:hypothetical protein [Clostridia bacterium]